MVVAHVEHGREDVVALVSSWSWIANLPDGRRAELLAAIRAGCTGDAAVITEPTSLEIVVALGNLDGATKNLLWV